jgi:serine/threonine protein kinase
MSEVEYPIINNYLLFKEMGSDAVGVDYRAGKIDMDERKAESHCLVTRVYSYLTGSASVWKRVNILLEGVRKSNIPKLYSPEEIIREDDSVYLVYPMMRGKTFEQVLDDSFKKDTPINFDLAFSIAFAIADLIDVGSSIVVSGEKSFHGFLTPDNIFVDYDGKIYLKNYGIYPYVSREEDIFNETVKKYGAWIAPEFLRKEKLVCQSDIYHLGYIIYKILTGKYFSLSPDEDFDAKFSNISFITHIPSSDKDFLTNIINFFKKTLHPMPSQRFANIKEFKDYISNKFHIEELSSVTFNLAYFMNSLYLEHMDKEKKELEQELAYTIPVEEEEVVEEVPVQPSKSSDEVVKDILTGLDEHERKSSKARLIIPLAAVLLIAVAIVVYVFIIQQKQVKQQAQLQQQTAADFQRKMEQQLAQYKEEIDAEYQKKIKDIENKAANTEEEQKAKDERIQQLKKEWQKEEARKAQELKKMEEARKAKLKAEEEERQKQEEAKLEQQRLAEQKKQEEAAALKKKQEEAKKLEAERLKTREGQLVALTAATKKPQKIKGKNPTFSGLISRKYRGRKFTVRAILLIDEKGNVAKIRMISKPPPDLLSRIEKVIQKWKYEPAQKDNVKVKVWVPIAIAITF